LPSLMSERAVCDNANEFAERIKKTVMYV